MRDDRDIFNNIGGSIDLSDMFKSITYLSDINRFEINDFLKEKHPEISVLFSDLCENVGFVRKNFKNWKNKSNNDDISSETVITNMMSDVSNKLDKIFAFLILLNVLIFKMIKENDHRIP